MQTKESYPELLEAHPELAGHCQLMLSSYQLLLGKPLIASDIIQQHGLAALFEAPFGLVSHDTQKSPIFNYGNRLALQLFERSWDDFTQMPSRQSVERCEHEDREQLLKSVTEKGYSSNYRGIRHSATGKRFYIDNTTVWNLIDDNGIYQGQAAAIFSWQPIN